MIKNKKIALYKRMIVIALLQNYKYYNTTKIINHWFLI